MVNPFLRTADDGERRCIVCGDAMERRKDWMYECHKCGFAASGIAAGAGTVSPGLDSLREHNFRRLLDRLESHGSLSGLRLLEVGCATGGFLLAAGARGARTTGIEPNVASAGEARKHGCEVLCGFFPAALPDDRRFDVVVFNDVFEHLPDPLNALQAVDSALSSGGILVLNLPSSKGIFYRTAVVLDRLGYPDPLERLWQKGLPSPHVSYFAPANLRIFVERHTSLSMIDGGRLESVDGTGLYARTRLSMGTAGSAMVTAVVLPLLPIIRRLPADIMFQIYRTA